MDYTLREQPLFTRNEILSTSTQQPVDLDFTLPDYCADIESILKCSMTVKLFNHSLSAGELRVEGTAIIRILYTDKDRKALRCYEQNHPFATSIPVTGEVGEHIIDIISKPEYINCRALTPRRLSVHGAFSLSVKIISRELHSFYSLETPCDLQTKVERMEISELKLFSQDRINISDVVSFKARKPIETIVRTDLSVSLTDQSHSGDKVTLTGELTLRMLYISDASTGEVDQYICVYPFKETIRTSNEDCDLTYANLTVATYEVGLKSEVMSDEPLIHLEATILADLFGFKNREAEYISDAYSIDYDTENEYEVLKLQKDVTPVNLTAIEKQSLSLGEKQVQKIIDILIEKPQVSGVFNENTLCFSGKIDVSILALTMDEELVLIDRQVDISHNHEFQKTFSHIDSLKCCVSSISYRLGDNTDIELRLELCYKALLWNDISVREIKSVNKLSESMKEKNKTPLILYYAGTGEKIWDISKRYNTCIDTLREENSLTCDELECDKMLMIFSS